MTCTYCQFSNTEDEHRCRRCGRRLVGTATAAPSNLAKEHMRIAVKVLGANALAAAKVTKPAEDLEAATVATRVSKARSDGQSYPRQDSPSANPRSSLHSGTTRAIDTAETLDELPRSRATQPTLFGAESQPKIIPFETIYRPAPMVISTGGGAAAAPALAKVPVADIAIPDTKPNVSKPATRPATRRKTAEADSAQATLEFLSPARGTVKTLKTSAEAVIFCDAVVAAPIHRATAGVLDMSMILVAFGAAAVIFQAVAQPLGIDRWALIALGALFGMATMFYGLLFSIAGCVTPGMRWTNLRLINFDGFPPDGRSRALRFLGYWISMASGGLGVLWALLDEENLTWHDHISKTFPTLTESESTVVRHRVR